MKAAFVLVKCQLGQIETVANELMEIEGVSEVHSITGPWDLLAKLYAPDYEAFAELIPGRVQKLAGIANTETLLAFRAFKPSGS
jgi:DNA-binding Lrp family transcriptional regulator